MGWEDETPTFWQLNAEATPEHRAAQLRSATEGFEDYDELALDEAQTTLTDERRGKKMGVNLNTVASLLAQGTYTVTVTFGGAGKYYRYKSMFNCEVGDQAVVSVQNKLKVVQVEEVVEGIDLDLDDGVEYSWLVTKVDTTQYERTLEAERKLVDTLKAKQRNKARTEAMAALIGELDDGGTLLLEAQAMFKGEKVVSE